VNYFVVSSFDCFVGNKGYTYIASNNIKRTVHVKNSFSTFTFLLLSIRIDLFLFETILILHILII